MHAHHVWHGLAKIIDPGGRVDLCSQAVHSAHTNTTHPQPRVRSRLAVERMMGCTATQLLSKAECTHTGEPTLRASSVDRRGEAAGRAVSTCRSDRVGTYIEDCTTVGGLLLCTLAGVRLPQAVHKAEYVRHPRASTVAAWTSGTTTGGTTIGIVCAVRACSPHDFLTLLDDGRRRSRRAGAAAVGLGRARSLDRGGGARPLQVAVCAGERGHAVRRGDIVRYHTAARSCRRSPAGDSRGVLEQE